MTNKIPRIIVQDMNMGYGNILRIYLPYCVYYRVYKKLFKEMCSFSKEVQKIRMEKVNSALQKLRVMYD